MSIFFQDPDEVRLPPEDVRLLSIHVSPIDIGGRIKVQLVLTPFLKRPNLEVIATNPAGVEIGQTTILETMLSMLEFTMHLREHEPGLVYRLEAKVYYQQPPKASSEQGEVDLADRMIVDQKVTFFEFRRSTP